MISHLKHTAGQALVETALVLPLVFLTIFGFIELALVVAEKQKLTYTAIYAAQTASLTNDDLKVNSAINESYNLTWGLNNNKKYVEKNIINQNDAGTTINSADRRFGDIVKISLKHDFILPFKLPLITEDISLISIESQAAARIICVNNEAPYTCNYE